MNFVLASDSAYLYKLISFTKRLRRTSKLVGRRYHGRYGLRGYVNVTFLLIVTTKIDFKMSVVLICHLDITIVDRVRLVSTHNATHTLVD